MKQITHAAAIESIICDLGITTNIAAYILHVEYKDIYKWIKNSEKIPSDIRLYKIYKLTQYWISKDVGILGIKGNVLLENGRCLFEMLTDDILDKNAIKTSMDNIANSCTPEIKESVENIVK